MEGEERRWDPSREESELWSASFQFEAPGSWLPGSAMPSAPLLNSP